MTELAGCDRPGNNPPVLRLEVMMNPAAPCSATRFAPRFSSLSVSHEHESPLARGGGRGAAVEGEPPTSQLKAHAQARPAGRLSALKLAGLAVVLGLFALPAAAQWAWREANGRVVYSDQPPPASVKSSQIVKQPGPRTFAPMPIVAGEPANDSKGEAKDKDKENAKPAGPKTYAEREMEFRKRQQEREQSEKKQQEEQARATQKAQECERMRNYMRALQDGVRVSRTDSQGNREVLEDAQREAEIKRMREALGRC
jgi:hypothetical protein